MLRRWNMRRILRRNPIPHHVWQHVSGRIAVLRELDAVQMAHLRELTTWFLHDKAPRVHRDTGCRGRLDPWFRCWPTAGVAAARRILPIFASAAQAADLDRLCKSFAVIKLLEIIQIHKNHSQRMVVAFCSCDFRSACVEKSMSIIQSSQGIAVCISVLAFKLLANLGCQYCH